MRSVAPGLPSGINETTPLVPRLLLPLAALLAVAPAVAQTPASTSVKLSKDSVVPLVFDWPVGTVAHVEVLKEEVRARDGETTDSTVSAVTYEMRVEAHPDGLVVAHSDVEIGAIEGADAGANLAEPRMNELANATVGALLPDFVVNTDGALIALDDVESLIARYREFLLAAAEADGAVDPDVQARTDEFLAGFLSPQVLTMMTASEWNAHVGGWAGAEMEVGAVYEVPSEGSVPIVPGATIPMTTTYTLTERVPCMKGEAGARCVALKFVSGYDEAALERILTEFVSGLAPDDEETPRFGDFRSETGARVVADPATLLPYRVETYKDIAVTVTAPEDEAGAFTRHDRKVTTYTYGD